MAGKRPNVKAIHFSPDLATAIESVAAKRQWTFATLVRVAVAEFVGQPELASQVQQGRPTTATKTPTKPAPKRGRKKLPK